MDELVLEGRSYISARRAAKEHGYASDYIGQLIRSGKLEGRKVGRGWFVEIGSLRAYMGSSPQSILIQNHSRAVDVAEEENSSSKVAVAVAHDEVVPSRPVRIGSISSAPVSVVTSRYPLLNYLPEDELDLPTLQKFETVDTEQANPIHYDVPAPHEENASRKGTRHVVFALACVGLVLLLGAVALSEQQIAYDRKTDTAASSFAIKLFR